MKKNILLFLLISLSSCSLDLKSEDEIIGKDVINTTQKAQELLNTAFYNLPIETEFLTILSQDLQPSYLIHYNPGYKNIYAWERREIEIYSNLLWESYYSSIAQINAVLNSEDYINTTDKKWNYIKGNALGLKAYIYFDLLQLFGERYNENGLGIVIKNNLKHENNARVSTQESIKIINDLIIEAIDLLDSNNDTAVYYLNKNALKLLQAQIALYTKNYLEAEKIALELIQDGITLPNTEKDYKSLWDNSITKSNSILLWARDYLKNPNYYLYESKEKGDFLYINTLFDFKEQDIRNAVSQYNFKMRNAQGTIDRNLLGKYKLEISEHDAKRIIIYRGAEVYFILIESLIEQNKTNEATAYLNQFLSSVNNETITENSSQELLKTRFQKEKQKEFIGEKINYYDLKRWNLPVDRFAPDTNRNTYTIKAEDYRWTFPIPKSEIRLNTEIKQNPNW